MDSTESNELNFQEFYILINSEMFDKLKVHSTEQIKKGNITIDFETVHSVCWMLCCNKLYTKKDSDQIQLNEEDVYHIWRIFNFLAEVDESGNPVFPLELDEEEARYVCNAFIQLTGQSNKEELVKTICKGKASFSFQDFQTLFLDVLVSQLLEKEKSNGLRELFSKVVLDVIKKGMVSKKGRGHHLMTWKDRWLVLTPKEILYYTASDEKDEKGYIKIGKSCTLELLTEKQKPNKFILHTPLKSYEICTIDDKTRNEWVSAIHKVINNCDSQIHFQRQAARVRRDDRRNRRKKADDDARRWREECALMAKGQRELEEERLRHLQDNELLERHKMELEAERKARAEAEARCREEAALRELEQKRLKELEEIKNELERLLEEERQAKRDEEIVRALQARILEEEYQKREELEKLKIQQEELLKNERLKREGLEDQKQEQEYVLREAQTKLDELENEKMDAAIKLQEAAEKLRLAEHERTRLQEKVKLWRTPTIGLARPVQPKVDPLITHRGMGAFCKNVFDKHTYSVKQPGYSDTSLGSAEMRINSDHNSQPKCDATNTTTPIPVDNVDNGSPDEINEP